MSVYVCAHVYMVCECVKVMSAYIFTKIICVFAYYIIVGLEEESEFTHCSAGNASFCQRTC